MCHQLFLSIGVILCMHIAQQLHAMFLYNKALTAENKKQSSKEGTPDSQSLGRVSTEPVLSILYATLTGLDVEANAGGRM